MNNITLRAFSSSIKEAVRQQKVGDRVTVQGWVRSVRSHKAVSFVELNDGSCLNSLQVVVPHGEVQSNLTTGVSARIEGTIAPTPGSNSNKRRKAGALPTPPPQVELHATALQVVGECDAGSYPLQKKHHSLEFLREIVHLRPRSNTFGAVARLRNALSQAVHRYFQDREFLQVHTPILTGNDAEGAGELFRVQTAQGDGEFFGAPAFLTVSGQLQAEAYACSMSKAYTFGPTFRAENSNTSRHLAEFWMVEPEVAFADLDDIVNLAESFTQSTLNEAMERCEEDVAFLDARIDSGLVARLTNAIDQPFARMTYTEAVEILRRSGHVFEHPVEWGLALQSEHERFLAEDHCKGPLFVTHYPACTKPFYMRQDDDCADGAETVRAMDMLVPRIGELIGGSQREERLDVLEAAIASQHACGEGEEAGGGRSDLEWYLDLRRYGTVPHAGWGMGFERLVQFATGMENIRDTIPMPRFPGPSGCKL